MKVAEISLATAPNPIANQQLTKTTQQTEYYHQHQLPHTSPDASINKCVIVVWQYCKHQHSPINCNESYRWGP